MSGRLHDDLRNGLGALVQVLDGVGELERAATSALAKADTIAGHMSDPTTIGRVAAASLGAALHAVGQEAEAAATTPHPVAPTGPATNAAGCNVLRCRTHDLLPWKGTIVCDACGRVFQVLDRRAPRFASDDCPCGVRLMPGAPGGIFSAAPICTGCFVGIAATGGRAVKKTRKEP